MKNDLPYLTTELLDLIFSGVYDIVAERPEQLPIADEKTAALTKVLHAMQDFNYRFRHEDTWPLFAVFDQTFHFERNSEGTTLWLALILAIQELYGFTNSTLLKVISQTKVRK